MAQHVAAAVTVLSAGRDCLTSSCRDCLTSTARDCLTSAVRDCLVSARGGGGNPVGVVGGSRGTCLAHPFERLSGGAIDRSWTVYEALTGVTRN